VQFALTVPVIRDRAVMMAAVLVLDPIFEADLPAEQYAYRRGRSALDAVRRVFKLINTGHREIVDADLASYFDLLPHAELLKSVARRVVDGAMLHLIKMWLKAPGERHAFTVTFPNGTSKRVQLGPDASCYTGSVLLGPKRCIRHLVGVSAALQANGSGMAYLVHLDGETRGLAWATVVSLLGLPAVPQWGDVVLGGMRRDRLIRRLDGIGCNPAVISGTRENLMERISEARKAGLLTFPESNGPILWPRFRLREMWAMAGQEAA
jgi:hypothetical protein